MTHVIFSHRLSLADEAKPVEKLIKDSFREPKYKVHTLEINPNDVAPSSNGLARSYNRPPVFFYDNPRFLGRIDFIENYIPLFKESRSVVLIHFEKDISSLETSEYFCNREIDHLLQKDPNLSFKWIVLNTDQKVLTPEQITVLKSVCESPKGPSTLKKVTYFFNKHLFIFGFITGVLATIAALFARSLPALVAHKKA